MASSPNHPSASVIKILPGAVEAAPIGIFVTDLAGKIIYANPHCLSLLQFTQEEFSSGWLRRVHPDERERISAAWENAIARAEPYAEVERSVRENGEEFWVEVSSVVLHDAEGQLSGHVAIVEDVTARVLAESKMGEQVQFLNNLREAVIVTQMDRTVSYWNKGAEDIYRWKSEEIIGQTIDAFLTASEEESRTIFEALCDRREWEGELRQTTKDGRSILVSQRSSMIVDEQDHPKCIFSIVRDITERKKIEIQTLRAQRLESLGTLAGGIAHDLNNILTPIMLSIEMLKALTTDEGGLKVLEAMKISAERGSDLVSQVLTFSRSEEGSTIDLQPLPFLKQIVKMARETFPRDVSVSFVQNPTLWKVRADPTRLEQAFLNLTVNARDAMTQGGLLTIVAENILLETTGKPFVSIKFIDNGEGIPPENLERIFDPFFTTKDLGKGTGLGLSTAQSIIQQHGGSISVQSVPGHGAEFQILLPAIVDILVPGISEPIPSHIHGKGETILVVDDEPSVREVAHRTLQAFGYRTLIAMDGAEAVEIYRAHQNEIALVFTDIMMPILNGIDASKAMFALNPKVKIIAASGLNARADLPEPFVSRLKNFLTKPYSSKTMLVAVREAIEQD